MRLYEFSKKDPYFAADDTTDASEYNAEADLYRENEAKSSKKRNDSRKGTNVVTKDIKHDEEKWTNQPEEGVWQSPGYRGGEEAKAAAGMPHKKFQKYDPNYIATDSAVNLGNGNIANPN